MDFEYKGKKYQLCELVEPNPRQRLEPFDICMVFEYTDYNEVDDMFESQEVVDWFYIDRDDIVAEAKKRLDWLESQKKQSVQFAKRWNEKFHFFCF